MVAGDRLADRIGIDVLAREFPPEPIAHAPTRAQR